MVENMVLLRAPVLTDQADKLGRRNFVQVLHQLLLQAWGANVVHFLWVNQRDQTISCLNQSIYFIDILMLIPRLMDTECVPSFANLGTHWTEVSLTGHMVHLYVVPQVGLVRGSKLTITTAPSACRRIFEDLSINQGCKEKLFMQE